MICFIKKMPVDKFGRGDYGETNIIQHTFDSSDKHADDIYLRQDGGNVATGSISMAEKTLNNVCNPTADHDVACKLYVDQIASNAAAENVTKVSKAGDGMAEDLTLSIDNDERRLLGCRDLTSGKFFSFLLGDAINRLL